MHKKWYFFVVLFIACCCLQVSGQQVITTIGGDGTDNTSPDGAAAVYSSIFTPSGVRKGYGGNIYFCEFGAQKVRLITPAGNLATIAGNGTPGYSGDNGPAINASIYNPSSVITDDAGNVYFIDQQRSVIRKVNTSGIITTIAGAAGYGHSGDGGPAAQAKFFDISTIVFDKAGNMLIAEYEGNSIRKITMATGIVTTIAGFHTEIGFSGDGGPATRARLYGPMGLAVDNTGNIYIAEADNRRIRKVSTAGIISTIAGTGAIGPGGGGDGGPATAATFDHPYDVAVDNAGNVYVLDFNQYEIRKITPAGIISHYTGTTGNAGFNGAPIFL
jgi:hypothetical protein